MDESSAFQTLANLCGAKRPKPTSRDYVREILLKDLRDWLIQTREQLGEQAQRYDLQRRLGYDKPEYLEEFLAAIWETFVEESCHVPVTETKR